MDDETKLRYFIGRELVDGMLIGEWCHLFKNGLAKVVQYNGKDICWTKLDADGPRLVLFTEMMDTPISNQWFRTASAKLPSINIERAFRCYEQSGFQPTGMVAIHITGIHADRGNTGLFFRLLITEFLFELEEDAVAWATNDVHRMSMRG